MNLIFLGAPGSGKGTQAESLVSDFGLVHISTGDLFRKAVSDQTELGRAAETFMSAGKLVPDDLVIGLFRERLKEKDCEKGLLLDGFPRTVPQAIALTGIFEEVGKSLDHVVYLEVDEEQLVKRLMGRGRADDTEATVRFRLKVYQEQTSPLVEHYAGTGLLRRVRGVGSVSEIAERVRSVLV